MDKETSLNKSASYFAILNMIEKSWIVMDSSELNRYLQTLEQTGYITAVECETLFARAIEKVKAKGYSDR